MASSICWQGAAGGEPGAGAGHRATVARAPACRAPARWLEAAAGPPRRSARLKGRQQQGGGGCAPARASWARPAPGEQASRPPTDLRPAPGGAGLRGGAPTHLEDLQQGGEGGVDHLVQRAALLLVAELVLARQEAQHGQRARDARLVLRTAQGWVGGWVGGQLGPGGLDAPRPAGAGAGPPNHAQQRRWPAGPLALAGLHQAGSSSRPHWSLRAPPAAEPPRPWTRRRGPSPGRSGRRAPAAAAPATAAGSQSTPGCARTRPAGRARRGARA